MYDDDDDDGGDDDDDDDEDNHDDANNHNIDENDYFFKSCGFSRVGQSHTLKTCNHFFYRA